MKYRQDRLSSLIREELGKIILRELEFPGALITITEVFISKNIDLATVKFSVLPSEGAREAFKILIKNQPRLQQLLLRQMVVKPMPKIVFEIDYGPEEAARVEELLKKG